MLTRISEYPLNVFSDLDTHITDKLNYNDCKDYILELIDMLPDEEKNIFLLYYKNMKSYIDLFREYNIGKDRLHAYKNSCLKFIEYALKKFYIPKIKISSPVFNLGIIEKYTSALLVIDNISNLSLESKIKNNKIFLSTCDIYSVNDEVPEKVFSTIKVLKLNKHYNYKEEVCYVMFIESGGDIQIKCLDLQSNELKFSMVYKGAYDNYYLVEAFEELFDNINC